MEMSRTKILVTPNDGPVDQPRDIRLGGFLPNEAITLESRLAPVDGSSWRGRAVFRADGEGEIALDSARPLSGDWIEADATAPVWAMAQERAPLRPDLGASLDPWTVELSAIGGTSGSVAEASFSLRFLSPGVNRREIRDRGLVGTLFTPPAPGPHPAILVLTGSGGGLDERRAALLAGHGYAALALGYFKAPGRPDHISDMPLEYFEAALTWLKELTSPRSFVAVSGVSRGGELSLLLGATFPDLVQAVATYVPSAVINGTLRAGRPGQTPDSTAWTLGGSALPNVWRGNPQADWSAFENPPRPGAPIRQEPAFHSVLRNPDFVAAARIPVERIRGPVLLISGTDDGFWPSTLYSRMIEKDLTEARHPWPVEHVVGEGAGHAIGIPQVPATEIAKIHPVAGVRIDGGGTAAANARASAEAWKRLLAFLDQASSA